MLVFSSYTSMLVWPVRQLGRTLADLGKASVSLGRIDEILEVPTEKEPGKALTPEIHGDIEFRHVDFGYEDGQEVLKDITFTAKRGETVAILGSTGSGKSSLVQLLQRLYTCRSGEILIDDVNINDIERASSAPQYRASFYRNPSFTPERSWKTFASSTPTQPMKRCLTPPALHRCMTLFRVSKTVTTPSSAKRALHCPEDKSSALQLQEC